MWSCPRCGESYFTAQTMHELERIKALRQSVGVLREAIARYEEQDKPAGLPPGIGEFRSGDPATASRTKVLLRRTARTASRRRR